jgi:pimeloyl-ACP methyl ester carboxylesterase
MLHIFIYGIETLLGSYCASRLLQIPGICVSYAQATCSQETIEDLILCASIQIDDSRNASISRAEIHNRCRPINVGCSQTDCAASVSVDHVWYFKGDRTVGEEALAPDYIIASLSGASLAEFNYVLFDCVPGSLCYPVMEPPERSIREELPGASVARLCQSRGIKYRIFQTSLITGMGGDAKERNSEVLSNFLASLHSFKAELDERSPQYFDFHSLRYPASADAALNLLSATLASDVVLRIASKPITANASFSVISPKHMLFSILCEHISLSFKLGFTWAEDAAEMNVVDRAFLERAGQLREYFESRPQAPDLTAYQAAGLPPETGVPNNETQLEQLKTICRSLDVARTECEQRTGEIPAALDRKQVTRDGLPVTYYAGGPAGPTIAVLNALGQGLEFWYRLIDQLVSQYRVIIWEPRGTISPPAPFGLADQVKDLNAILRNEAVESCHLLGWCTGPKVIVDFYLLRPEAVASMVFLNGAFKCSCSPEELDSPYEKSLEFLCRKLVVKPAMVASLRRAFRGPATADETDALVDISREEAGMKVLSRVSLKPRSWVLAPFQSEETTLNYAHQMVDFWANDVRSKFGSINVPVLLLTTEYDEVVTARSSRMAVELLPNARHIHVPAATHYCLYDRPEFVAHLLHNFFRSGGGTSAPQTEDTVIAVV